MRVTKLHSGLTSIGTMRLSESLSQATLVMIGARPGGTGTIPLIAAIKSTLAGRVCNSHSSPVLAFLHIDVTIRHQIAGVKQAANHFDWSLLQL